MKSVSLVKVTALVCIAAVASIAISANANSLELGQLEQKADLKETFSLVDLDKNGELSKAEVITSDKSMLKKAFDMIDADKSGAISFSEMQNYMKQKKVKK